MRTHPADTTLILAIDRELSLVQRIALDRHLKTCEACRSRLEAFDRTAQETTRACRGAAADTDLESTGALRHRLQTRMTELRTDWDRSPLYRFRRVARSVPAFAGLGVTVAFLALVVRLVQPHVSVSDASRASQLPSLPNSHFTPGATSTVSAASLCAGTLPARRVVSVAVRQRVLREYQMEHVDPSEYELDYLITPELGGVGDANNLWPQRYEAGVWNARVKDDLERLLPRLVCDGTVDLGSAQREIAGNWIDAYKKYFKTDQPVPRRAGFVDDDDDEIVFEPTPNDPIAAFAFVSFVPPPTALSADTHNH